LVAIGAATIIVAAFGSVDYLSASGARGHDVTISGGIALDDAIDAFGNENLKNQFGINDILVFSKSGGAAADGQMQHVLRVDLPFQSNSAHDDVGLQYFVNVRNDLDGANIFHCSDIRLHVFLDHRKVITTEWLGYDDRDPSLPKHTDIITIHDVRPGSHHISLLPESRTGGCNSGFLQSWGGTAILFD